MYAACLDNNINTMHAHRLAYPEIREGVPTNNWLNIPIK